MKIHQIKTSETGTIVSIYHKTSGIDKAAIDDPQRQGAVRAEPKVGALGEHPGATVLRTSYLSRWILYPG
jgi:hypothetical protein